MHIIILKKKKRNAIKWKLAEKCPTAPDTVLPATRVEEGGAGLGILVSGHLCFFCSILNNSYIEQVPIKVCWN